jgi:hypothetical protein
VRRVAEGGERESRGEASEGAARPEPAGNEIRPPVVDGRKCGSETDQEYPRATGWGEGYLGLSWAIGLRLKG